MGESDSVEKKGRVVKNKTTGKFIEQKTFKVHAGQPPSIDEVPPPGYKLVEGRLVEDDLANLRRRGKQAAKTFENQGRPMGGAKDD